MLVGSWVGSARDGKLLISGWGSGGWDWMWPDASWHWGHRRGYLTGRRVKFSFTG